MAEPIEMSFGVWTRIDRRNHVFRWRSRSIATYQGAFFRGKDMPGHVRRHSAVSCANMAEPIEMPFVLMTLVGPTSTQRYTTTQTVSSRSVHRFLHSLRRVSSACTGMSFPLKLPIRIGIWTLFTSNTWCLGPTRVHNPKIISTD